MTDILIPKHLNMSLDPQWEMLEQVLPNGYRHVASVERSDGTMYDLGQNNDGNYLLFRRCTDPFSLYSHAKGERLSPTDLAGFGLQAHQSRNDALMAEEEGEYSSLCTTNVVGMEKLSLFERLLRSK